MIPNGSKLELGTIALGSEAVKKGWNAFSTLNNAIDGVRKVANDVVRYNSSKIIGNENYKEELGNSRIVNIIEKIEVGQVYGRLKNDLKLIQIFERETKSMGTLEIISMSNNLDFSYLNIRWRRKIGEKLIDIQGKDSSLKYNLTADDVGTIIIIEICPKGEANDPLNITYCELGPIEIDDTTKISLSKSLKTGLIRFPVEIIKDEFENLIDPENSSKELKKNEDLALTKDILVVTNDDVKVIKNGMASSNSSFEKKIVWSAKYFGGNIHIQLNHQSSSCQEFTLCSGYDIHKQKISIRATSRNARDIATLTIRCLNIRHTISLEAIIGGGVSWIPKDSTANNLDNIEIEESRKLNIFAYIGRLEDEIANLENKKEKLNEDKRLLQNEKAILENELAETISAYQDIISQYQQEKDTKINTNKQAKEFNIEFGVEKNTEIKQSNYSPNKKSAQSNSNNSYKSTLLHGYSGAYPLNNSKLDESSSSKNNNNSHKNESIKQDSTEINKLLEENASFKQSTSQLNQKFEDAVGAKEAMERMHAEIEELRGRLEISDKEKRDYKRLNEKLDSEIFVKNQELESIKSGQGLNLTRNIEKIQQLEDRILDLQSQNSEKQQAIQTLSTEKFKLLKDYSSLKLDFDKLKEQHNQLNKRYISLNLENSRILDQEKSSKLDNELVNSDSKGKIDQIADIEKLKSELEDCKKTNCELNQTITQLKTRIRRLAMINST
ncbi:Uncharacterized protein cmbei_6004300 [Cryptosporidium meleagridis]